MPRKLQDQIKQPKPFPSLEAATFVNLLRPHGRSAVDALDAPVRKLHSRQLGHFSRADLETLNTLLERARESGES